MLVGNIDIKWLGHSGFFIRDNNSGLRIYIGPHNIREDSEKADLIFLTHSHHDHLSLADLNKVVGPNTRVLAPPDCQSTLTRFKVPVRIQIVEEGMEFSFGDLRIVVMPAYNTDKPFHSKDEGWVGYLIKFRDVVLYYAGDTDVIPEMQKLTGHKHDKEFVALLPVGGRFFMTADEAFEAAKILKPSLAIPMSFGGLSGTEEDAKEFIELCNEEGIKAVILEKS